MSIIPIITAKQLLSVLLKTGFQIARQKGSHIRLENIITKKSTTVPLHTGDLSRKMISQILKQAGVSVSDFLKILGK